MDATEKILASQTCIAETGDKVQVRAAQHSSSQGRRAKQEHDFSRCLCKTWCFCEALKTRFFCESAFCLVGRCAFTQRKPGFEFKPKQRVNQGFWKRPNIERLRV